MLRAHHFRRRKIKFLAHLVNKRIQGVFVFCLVFVNFIDHQHHGDFVRQLLQHGAVGFGKAHGFHHEGHCVHAAHRFGHVQVQAVVERVAVVGLETRRVHKHELRRVVRVNAGYLVPRGLRLFAGDADFLPDQMVHQRGFAHVRAADNGNEAAAVSVCSLLFVGQKFCYVHMARSFRLFDNAIILVYGFLRLPSADGACFWAYSALFSKNQWNVLSRMGKCS